MNQQGINSRLLNVCIALITATLLVYILIIGKALLLPLLTAVAIWYLIIRLAATFSSIPFTKTEIPFGIALLLSIIISGIFIYGFVTLVTHSIQGILHDAPKYQDKLMQLMNYLNTVTHSKFNFQDIIQKINFTRIFSNAALALTNITGNLVLIIIYVLFLILEYSTFNGKIKAMCRDQKQYSTMNSLLDKVSEDINTYMKVKTGVSVLTGLLSYATLLAFGVPYAQFWALLIFLLNYIPTVGSIVAVALTILAVSIQFSTLGMFILMAVILILIQLVVGNIVEPRFMGKNLNLSPLIILLALGFWGSIWGVLGMILCVPLMTILNIVLSKFDNTRPIAVLFSANPEILNE